MREDRRRRYDDGFRREALELIKSGAGKDALVRRLAILVYTARNWIRLYRFNGEEAVMGGGGSRRYDWETKVAAARDHVENGLTKTEAMASKEIVAWDVSRSPDLGQQKRLPAGAEPILHSDMGWQYQHQWWRKELERLGIRQSMSRKGNCLDNAAAEQVFGHLKDEFYRGRVFDSYEQFKRELDAYIIHWNTRRRQIRLEGRTPEEFRSMSLAV